MRPITKETIISMPECNCPRIGTTKIQLHESTCTVPTIRLILHELEDLWSALDGKSIVVERSK